MKPEMRRQLAQLPYEEKIRKVGELIRLSQNVKKAASNTSGDAELTGHLDAAAEELDAGEGIPTERARERIQSGN